MPANPKIGDIYYCPTRKSFAILRSIRDMSWAIVYRVRDNRYTTWNNKSLNIPGSMSKIGNMFELKNLEIPEPPYIISSLSLSSMVRKIRQGQDPTKEWVLDEFKNLTSAEIAKEVLGQEHYEREDKKTVANLFESLNKHINHKYVIIGRYNPKSPDIYYFGKERGTKTYTYDIQLAKVFNSRAEAEKILNSISDKRYYRIIEVNS
jgi:hypothetical protein